jgi:hypothetical protein
MIASNERWIRTAREWRMARQHPVHPAGATHKAGLVAGIARGGV